VRRWTVDPGRPDERRLDEAAAVIRGGGVVVFPTDTLYGLAADPRDPRAVERVFAIKRRAEREPLPLIAASLEAAAAVGQLTPLARRLAGAFWPGPVTVIVQDAGVVASGVHAGTHAVAVRVPASAIAAGLARLAGGAITATSANRSGAPAPSSAGEVDEELGREADGLLDGGRAPGGRPSTIVDARGEAPLLVRAGAVAYERILEAMERR
jgi:L-threonylcarbamoyladenylate synthase